MNFITIRILIFKLKKKTRIDKKILTCKGQTIFYNKIWFKLQVFQYDST